MDADMKMILNKNWFRSNAHVVILGLSIILSSCAQGYEITSTKIHLPIGESEVDLVLHQTSVPGLTYLNLHDDENTSVRAALDVIRQHGGRVFELKHSGARNITFELDGIKYEFDPNRMFNSQGAAASLERFGPVGDAAISAVSAFADEVLQQIMSHEAYVIVTLHNNDQSGYSVLSYLPDGSYASEALRVHVGEGLDPDDFYFVTDPDLYDQLQQADLNVVLQDNVNVTNDGSLSVWSTHHQFPYVNVEAQDGHRRSQANMIMFLHELFFPSGDFGVP
jgi:hypothetical protein